MRDSRIVEAIFHEAQPGFIPPLRQGGAHSISSVAVHHIPATAHASRPLAWEVAWGASSTGRAPPPKPPFLRGGMGVFRNLRTTIAYSFCAAFFLVGCSNEQKPPIAEPTAANAEAQPRQTIEPIQPAAPSQKAPQGTGQLRIAAASDLQFALGEVCSAFERTHPGAAITMQFGSSGSFFAQLTDEAPFDLFLSADIDFARRLVEQGQAAPGSDFTYAQGHIVVWELQDSPQPVEQRGIETLREAGVQKIAIANPKTAPYGRAAVAALKSLGVYDAVEPKLVYGENVAQTAQMVESGAADLGIIALSLAVSPALRDKGRYWPVPGSAHPPIVQGGNILRWAQDAALAGEFRDFLLSGAGQSILSQFGFDEVAKASNSAIRPESPPSQ